MTPGGDFLQAGEMSTEYCRRRARELLEQLGVTVPPVDVEAIARSLGLTVTFVRRGTGFDGQLLRERMVIEVNASKLETRQRFTIAHEIGHYQLGHSPVVCVTDDRSIADPTRINERQANAFGSELLMPEPWIRDHWRQLTNIQSMAGGFMVSDQAMYYRLEDLNLLDLPPRR
jgi:Zn-dependent peptidase ImmA (M78 family)